MHSKLRVKAQTKLRRLHEQTKTQRTNHPALASTLCACGKTKSLGLAFCNNCFYALPRDLRSFLYKRVGDGFEGAYDVALEFLIEKHGDKHAS